MTVRMEQLRSQRVAAARKVALRLNLSRFLPAAILAGYGIFILSLFLRHIMTWYINPNYVIPTTIAGALLIGLSVVRLTSQGEEESCCATGSCCADGSCGSAAPKLWSYLLLSFPLLLALIFPPRSLAAFSALQRGIQVAGTGTGTGLVTRSSVVSRVSLSIDTRTFGMQDWVGALSADPNPKDFLGKPINLAGLVVHNSASAPPGYIMVIRYQVTCCIADARPEGLVVRDTSHGKLQDNQWVSLTGKMGETDFQGQKMAVVIPSRMMVIKARDPYMY